jgi:Cu/Ag efflux protein CusF
MKAFIFLVLILAISGCQQNAAETKQATKPAQTASATPQPTSSVPKNGNYNGKGVVTKIDLKLVSVEMDHEEIKDLMPPMRMEFYAKEKSELEKLKVGDNVEFVVEYKDGQEKIITIKKTQ